jgi:hypothetical protein
VPEAVEPKAPASEASQSSVSEELTGATTHKTPPGPDIVPKPVPTLDQLPEPIVIAAQDLNPVQTQPKGTPPAPARSDTVRDREEIGGPDESAP